MPNVPASPLTAKEYWDELQLISDEVFEAKWYFHTMEEINEQLLNDKKVYFAINRTPHFWQAHRAATQAALFMTLGRIFDTSPDALSVHRLLRLTLANIHLFSRQSLEDRRLTPGKDAPQYLIDFIDGAWEPKAANELRYLKQSLAPHAAHFEDIYRPIRHNVYGHRLMTNAAAGNDLFPQTSRPQLAEITDFLHALTNSLEHLYNNGSKPDLAYDFTIHNEKIRDEAKHVLRILAENEPDDG